MTDISSTLEERGARYGSFDTHAEITQQLKFVIYKSLFEQKKSLTPSMKEALDMIAHKIGRIINGDPFYADSWIDIAGYAQLVADQLDKDEIEEQHLGSDFDDFLREEGFDELVELQAQLDDRLTDGQKPVRVSLDELDAAVPAIEEEVNESHSQFGPVTDEHREWAKEILNDLASQRQGEL